MIHSQTLLSIADNTGAKEIMCIRVLGSNKQYWELVDKIIAVVKHSIPNLAVKRAEIVRAVIVRTQKTTHRRDGSYIRFDENAAVILNLDGNPRGTRVFGPIAREIRDKGFSKIISLANDIL